MARDLVTSCASHAVVVADMNPASLARLPDMPRLRKVATDLSNAENVRSLIAGADAVVCAVPGFMGFQTVKTVIEAGKNVSDISFMPQNQLELDSLAKSRGVQAVVDMGVSPGLSNLFIGMGEKLLGDGMEKGVIYVGGLPYVRKWPYEYRIVFSAVDVLEEYTRPARLREAGKLVTKTALSEIELLDFPGIGTLEAFNTDGLRTLLVNMKAPNLKEKTMRWPGHAERMRMLRETGLLSEDPMELKDGTKVRPIDVTSKLLFDQWKLPAGEREFTVLRVECEGKRESSGKRVKIQWDLLDSTDEKTGLTSMARTTGFPCASMARLLANKEGKKLLGGAAGVITPEMIPHDEAAYRLLMDDLTARNVVIRQTETELP